MSSLLTNLRLLKMRIVNVLAVSFFVFLTLNLSVSSAQQLDSDSGVPSQEFEVQKKDDGRVCYVLRDKISGVTLKIELKDDATLQFQPLVRLLGQLVIESLEQQTDEIKDEIKEIVTSRHGWSDKNKVPGARNATEQEKNKTKVSDKTKVSGALNENDTVKTKSKSPE